MAEFPSVVLVEDSLPYAKLVAVILRDALPGGIDVRHHATLGAALDDLAVHDADCVLLDLSLPDADGLEGLCRLQAAGTEASIVVLSGREDDELALEAIQAGAQDYLLKGDERQPDVFGRAIRYAIERRRAQRRSEELLRGKEDRWRSLTQLAPVGILETDAQGRCLVVNERWSEIAGRPLSDAQGLGWLRTIHPGDRERFTRLAREALEDGGEYAGEGRLVRPDGVVRWVHVSGVVLRDGDGTPTGWLGTVIDVTEDRRAAAAVREAEARFRGAFDDAPIGMTITDAGSSYLDVNRSFCTLVGRTREELLGRASDELTHPDDRAVCAEHAERLRAGEVGTAQWEQRFLHRDGHAVWTRISVSVVHDDAGAVTSYVSQIEDIGERRAAEQELQRQQLDMLAIAAMSRDAGLSEDPLVPLCTGARRLLGADMALLAIHDGANHLEVAAVDGTEVGLGTRIELGGGPSGAASSFLARERLEVRDARVSGAISTHLAEAAGARTVVFEPVVRGADVVGVLAAAWRSVVEPLGPRQGTVLRLAAAEIAAAIERRRLLDQLRDLARTDPLTGLANRRVWDERLAVELGRASRSAAPVCVAMLDLDRFKAYNDRNGHQAGDRLLRETTAAWQGTLRTGDLMARMGGDEFAVLLPDCELDGAGATIARLQRVTHPDVGASAGVVRWAAGEDPAVLIGRADAALYVAKDRGAGALVIA